MTALVISDLAQGSQTGHDQAGRSRQEDASDDCRGNDGQQRARLWHEAQNQQQNGGDDHRRARAQLAFAGQVEQADILRVCGGGESTNQRGNGRTCRLAGEAVAHLLAFEGRALNLGSRLIDAESLHDGNHIGDEERNEDLPVKRKRPVRHEGRQAQPSLGSHRREVHHAKRCGDHGADDKRDEE